MFITELPVAGVGVAKLLSLRVIQLMHPHFLHILLHYDQAITDDARWIFKERNVQGANNGVTTCHNHVE